MTTTQCTCTGCAVQQGTHQPAEALHQQIDEPQAEAMRLADECDESATHWVHEIDTRLKAAKMLRAQHARIAELEGQLDAIGAGGVEPLRKPAAAPQAVQAAVPLFWVRLLRGGLYEGPIHNNSVGGKMLRDENPGEWHPLYLHASPARPAEGVPAAIDPGECSQDVFDHGVSVGLFDIPKNEANAICAGLTAATGARVDWHYIAGRVHMKAIAATQPAAQGVDVVQAAKALCKHAAKVQNVNFDDYWLIHAEEFKEEAQIVLDAAQAKQGEQQ